jgi:hypothetical protein
LPSFDKFTGTGKFPGLFPVFLAKKSRFLTRKFPAPVFVKVAGPDQ